MSRRGKKVSAASNAPKVWHPAWCKCGGSGILSGDNSPVKQPNGEITWKNGARCPGLLKELPPRAPDVDGRARAAGDGREA